MDETGMLNPIFRKVTNIKKQSGINQMGIKQINQNMENQFDSNMMIQNSFSINNPMKNQNMGMDQRNKMENKMEIQNMNQGNIMMNNQMMNLLSMNLMLSTKLNEINSNNLLKNNCNNTSDNEVNKNSNTFINIKFRSSHEFYVIQIDLDDKVSKLIEKYNLKANDNDMSKKFIFNSKVLNVSLTIREAGLYNQANIFVVTKGIKGAGGAWYQKEINIKFIKSSKNCDNKISNCQLDGLLKLCLLKEISSKLSNDELIKLPEIIKCIMRILKSGYIETEEDIKKTIKEVLLKIKGSNIINFSEYVDEIIDANQLDKIIKLLDGKDLKEIKDIRFRLSKYNKFMEFFMEEFDKTKKESIFEFSVISLVVMEREDFEKFKKEREKCPNRVDKILYHGTSIEPISCILTEQFKKSLEHYQHGKGVYFTDLLDYCWFYGSQDNNRANQNIIPRLEGIFTLIACSVYYNKKGFRKVTNSKYTPKKMK